MMMTHDIYRGFISGLFFWYGVCVVLVVEGCWPGGGEGGVLAWMAQRDWPVDAYRRLEGQFMGTGVPLWGLLDAVREG